MSPFLLLAAVPAVLALPVAAQDLRIGVASEATSVDPHFHNLGPNNGLRRHIFDSLVSTDANQKLVPSLAASWTARDERTWEVKLRPNVVFSDGSPFTATDVLYTFCRVPLVENSPSSFTNFVRGFEAITVPDPLTLVMRTSAPTPLLPNNMSTVGILSSKALGGDKVEYDPKGCRNLGTPPRSVDFNEPAKAIGTGPYRLSQYTRGTSTVLARNDRYWGDKPIWATVTLRPMASQGPRVAALLAGDVDLIENPPIQDFDKIKGAGFGIAQGISNRLIYLAMDQFRGDPNWRSPGIRGTDKNPFLDLRVRQALSKAINRPAIVDRIMGGVAQASADFLPVPLFGTRPDAQPERFDLDGARKLLAEAGFPNGFEVTLGAPNDRYINDDKIAPALAQMLTRAGLKVTVDAMTASTFFSRRNKGDFSLYLAGWGADSGEMTNPLVSLVATPNPQTGMGPTNRGRYSNAEIDALIGSALTTVDDTKREDLLRRASKLAIDDLAVIPLHFEVTPWAFRKGLGYRPRIDQYTLATEVERSGP